MQCLNLSNKEVLDLYNEYTELFGDSDIAYYLLSENNGYGLDKAPNGADSNLYKDILDLLNGDRKKSIIEKAKVYTDSFINWFGDWINNPNNSSKVVDANGEPMIVYTGVPVKNLKEFSLKTKNRASLTGLLDKRIYFSKDIGVAKQYTEGEYKYMTTNEVNEEAAKNINRLYWGGDIHDKDARREFIGLDDDIIDNYIDKFTSEETGEFNNLYKEEGEVLAVFLNMRNPVVIKHTGQTISYLSEEDKTKINKNESAIIENVDERTSNGVYYKTTDYLISNPNNIKAAIGNSGNFSRTDNDINNYEYNNNDFFDEDVRNKDQIDDSIKENTVYGIDKVEELFFQYAIDKEQIALARKVFNVARKIGFKVSFLHKNLGFNIGGRADGDVIQFSHIVTQKANLSKMPDVLLHEIIHGVTVYAIDAYNNGDLRNKEVSDAIETLYDVYDEIKNKESLSKEYGIKNVKEMVAEIANPSFRNKLKFINLWESIKNSIKKILYYFSPGNISAESAVAKALDTLLDNYDSELFDEYARTKNYNESDWDFYEYNGSVIANNISDLNLPPEEIDSIYENYINMMDRKREGKGVPRETFDFMMDHLPVFKSSDTYFFGEWDSKNLIFKARLLSSPSIRSLYNGIDDLREMVDVVASVPEDIGNMLLKKGFHKLSVGKEYNFKGEDMIKNLYFSDKKLVRKIFGKDDSSISTDEVKSYDEFFNYWSLVNKLKKYAKNKDRINIFKTLKKIGIYDRNAYMYTKKFSNQELSDSDMKNVVNAIITNSAVNFVNINNTDAINSPKTYRELDTQLNKLLAEYLSKFGIKTEVLSEMQDNLNIDGFGSIDLLNRVVYAHKNNIREYPSEAGRMIAFMMQFNPLVQEIISDMRRLSMFKNLNDTNEYLSAIGDLISDELHRKTNTEIPKTLMQRIRILIDQFFSLISGVKIKRINRNIGYIADNILLKNEALIKNSTFKPGNTGEKTVKVDINEALKTEKFASDIVDKMSDYFILAGSLAISTQGTVYRPSTGLVHDLDWISVLGREKTKKVFEEMFPNSKYIRSIPNEGYITDTWLIVPDGYTIGNLVLKGDRNKVVSYDIFDEYNNIVSTYDGVSDSFSNKKIFGKLIDIFSQESANYKTTKLDSGKDLMVSSWKDSFKAKLEYMRLKDIWDFNRFVPNENLNDARIEDFRLPNELINEAETIKKICKG